VSEDDKDMYRILGSTIRSLFRAGLIRPPGSAPPSAAPAEIAG
jgi:hypothetical protein